MQITQEAQISWQRKERSIDMHQNTTVLLYNNSINGYNLA